MANIEQPSNTINLPATTRTPVPDSSSTAYSDHSYTVYSDLRVTDLNTAARYVGHTSTDNGTPWTPIPMPDGWDTVCGGHVQSEAASHLIHGYDVTADGTTRITRDWDGTLTRWTIAATSGETGEQRGARQAQERAGQLAEKAEKLTAESERRFERADAMYGRFAGGQPLLSGHHSYRSARRTKDRANAASDRAIDAYKAAQRAQAEAKAAKAKADARTEIADAVATRSRPWEPADFQVGDIVTVRVFETSTSTYRVKRVNKKTLTLDGGGGGWDDPKREYDRVLSRTRDNVTTTNPDVENQ